MSRRQASNRVREWAPIQHYTGNRIACYYGRYSLYFFYGHSVEVTIPCGHTIVTGDINFCYRPLNVTEVTNVTLVGYCRFCQRQVGSIYAPLLYGSEADQLIG